MESLLSLGLTLGELPLWVSVKSVGGLEKTVATWEMILLLNLMIRKWAVYCNIRAPKPLKSPEKPSSWRMVLKQSPTPSYLVRMGVTSIPAESRLSMMLLVPCRWRRWRTVSSGKRRTSAGRN